MIACKTWACGIYYTSDEAMDEELLRLNVQKSNYRSDIHLLKNLFYGSRDSDNHLVQQGFREFRREVFRTSDHNKLKALVGYLQLLGFHIQTEYIQEAINKRRYNFYQVLNKTNSLFKTLLKRSRLGQTLNENELSFFRQMEMHHEKAKAIPKINPQSESVIHNRYITIPPNFGNDEKVAWLHQILEESSHSIFLTGKAGTGKSTFIEYFRQNTKKKVLVLAYTGLAAINVGGQTIHSFFKFPLRPLMPADPDIPIFSRSDSRRDIIANLDLIIIDEVSMLRSDLLEAMNYSLQLNGGKSGEVFGGKQLLFVGDIFQLPPIVDSSSVVEREIFETTYRSEYFFDSPSYQILNPRCYELTTVHRQQDVRFIKLLNQVRECTIRQEELESINQECFHKSKYNSPEFAIVLTVTNRLAAKENSRRLQLLPDLAYEFEARIFGDFPRDRFPAERVLVLKKDAQVMLIRNDPPERGKRWVNGTIGRIDSIRDDGIFVKLPDGRVLKVLREKWENLQFQWDSQKSAITTSIKGSFEQFPLRLAWAITIHKSQGLTFNNIILDLGAGTFAPGQLYTALSRCTTIEGLKLKRKIRETDVISDRRLLEFYKEKILSKMK